jgi:hypothetical protein
VYDAVAALLDAAGSPTATAATGRPDRRPRPGAGRARRAPAATLRVLRCRAAAARPVRRRAAARRGRDRAGLGRAGRTRPGVRGAPAPRRRRTRQRLHRAAARTGPVRSRTARPR